MSVRSGSAVRHGAGLVVPPESRHGSGSPAAMAVPCAGACVVHRSPGAGGGIPGVPGQGEIKASALAFLGAGEGVGARGRRRVP